MSELQKAIETITYESKIFPGEAFRIIAENKDEAIPYLRSAIEKAIDEKENLEEDYLLHFYALFLLGEFQDREFFPRLMEFVSLPGEVLDFLIGDAITSNLKDILYNTYNGDISLLKDAIMNKSTDEYVRADLLDVMGQLYLDGSLEEKEWREFLKQCVYADEEYSYFYNAVAMVICKCHFADMLPDIKYLFEEDLLDTMCMGEYDSCVDQIFAYNDCDKNFCEASLNASDILKSWAMFEDPDMPDMEQKRKEFEKMMKKERMRSEAEERKGARKVGRNDPCPCGSGKKYKFCCLNKPKSPLDAIESAQERGKWLKRYPYTGKERLENRIYLNDYFDEESIEIDKLLYLGLMNRPGWIWLRDEKQEEKRCREYLGIAFEMFLDKTEKEGIRTFEEYDRRFSIHYFCEEWIIRLLELLRESGNEKLYRKVRECRKEMLQ